MKMMLLRIWLAVRSLACGDDLGPMRVWRSPGRGGVFLHRVWACIILCALLAPTAHPQASGGYSNVTILFGGGDWKLKFGPRGSAGFSHRFFPTGGGFLLEEGAFELDRVVGICKAAIENSPYPLKRALDIEVAGDRDLYLKADLVIAFLKPGEERHQTYAAALTPEIKTIIDKVLQGRVTEKMRNATNTYPIFTSRMVSRIATWTNQMQAPSQKK